MDHSNEEQPKIPQEKSRSFRQLVASLHFSGKVIIGSVLFGFGLVLVGAILLAIATGSQKVPPLQMTPDDRASTLVYVGPGVMGIGAFLIIVGTAMCLIETRVLRRRGMTEASLLSGPEHVETLPKTLDAASTGKMASSGHLEHIQEESIDVSRSMQQETDLEANSGEPLNQSAAVQDSCSALTTSVYADAKEAIDPEDQLGDDSTQFKTPPESSLLNSSELDPLSDCREETTKEHPFIHSTKPPLNTQISSSL